MTYYLATIAALIALMFFLTIRHFQKKQTITILQELAITIALSFIASYIFFIVNIHIPQKDSMETRGVLIAHHLNKLITISDDWKTIISNKENPIYKEQKNSDLPKKSYDQLNHLEKKYCFYSRRVTDLSLDTDLELAISVLEITAGYDDIANFPTKNYLKKIKIRIDSIRLVLDYVSKSAEHSSLSLATAKKLKKSYKQTLPEPNQDFSFQYITN